MSYSNLESEEQERKLFVGGLNRAATDEERLKSFFKDFGAIIDCTIMRDMEKNSRGFGFVLFEKASSVDDIIASRKEGAVFSLDDHNIEVKRALPKVPGGNAGSSRTGGLYRKIFVGGLPSTIHEDDLKKYFSQFGLVNEVELLRCRETNRLRGFAFVTFDDEDSADKCIQRRNHEICKKICEVKRAQTRSNLTKFDSHDSSNRGGSQFGAKSIQMPQGNTAAPSSLSMTEVNQLIQQAFAMGQQSVSSGVQAPTAATLLGGLQTNNVQNTLLSALLGQQAPPVPAPAAPTANSGAINQLAQLLAGRGVDASALNALLKPDASAGHQQQPHQPKHANGYQQTSYPAASTYDMYYGQGSSSYGPTKEDDSKRGYRPY